MSSTNNSSVSAQQLADPLAIKLQHEEIFLHFDQQQQQNGQQLLHEQDLPSSSAESSSKDSKRNGHGKTFYLRQS